MGVGEFIERACERTGDALRFAGWYDGGRTGVLYVRDDLRASVASDTLDSLFDRVRWADPVARGPGSDPLGDRNATVEFREHGIVAHFPIDEGEGLIVCLEDDARDEIAAVVREYEDGVEPVGLAFRGAHGEDEGSKRCPHCGSQNYAVKSSRPGRPRKHAANYQCRYCGEEFDEPIIADSRLSVLEED